MDFKQIEAYVKVIELASFSKAADAIFLSQPSVSTYINALEKELDTTLINRSTKEVSPTLAGKIFYENAKELLALKHNTAERIKNLSGNLSGELNILASTVPSQYILPEILARFNALYPDISFNIKQADTLEVSRGIASQKADIGFSGGIAENDKCDFTEIMTEQMVFIAPYGQGFSDSKAYSLEELLYEHRFVSREKGSGTRAQYESFFSENNIDLNKINAGVSFDNTQSIINAVINGLGISVVSEFAARAFIEQKMIMPVKLSVEFPERKFYYVLKKNFSYSHLIGLFIDFILQKAIQ
ncbi:MAG: selenium metabolism-associated LysR family transcriptional regulator [Defluviitaleaceae bacterium]|nr:selenium metabolism-associated LysR family transcriptional regulator [Defluviitaleaceae bacterium]